MQHSVSEPTTSKALCVTLNNSRVITVVEDVNDSTGVVVYGVNGPRLCGMATIIPWYGRYRDTTPTKIWLRSGTPPCTGYNYKQRNFITINSIEIEVSWHLEPHEQKRDPYDCLPHRIGDYGGYWNLPDATRAYAREVLDALAGLWLTRTDKNDLLHAAAQTNASDRLLSEMSTARSLTAKINELRAELAASDERMATYRQLQQEYETKYIHLRWAN